MSAAGQDPATALMYEAAERRYAEIGERHGYSGLGEGVAFGQGGAFGEEALLEGDDGVGRAGALGTGVSDRAQVGRHGAAGEAAFLDKAQGKENGVG